MSIQPPFPYADSLTPLLPELLALVPPKVDRLLEPFVGGGAFTIAAAQAELARTFVVGDDLDPLVGIWQLLIERPRVLTEGYAAQVAACRNREDVLADWRRCQDPISLLTIFALDGGLAPDALAQRIDSAHALLRGRTVTQAGDFSLLLRAAQPEDFVLMDPPARGAAQPWHPSWHEALNEEHLQWSVTDAIEREVRFVLLHEQLDHPGVHITSAGSRRALLSPALVRSIG